jgi:hypothetical protein
MLFSQAPERKSSATIFDLIYMGMINTMHSIRNNPKKCIGNRIVHHHGQINLKHYVSISMDYQRLGHDRGKLRRSEVHVVIAVLESHKLITYPSNLIISRQGGGQ